MWPIKYIATQKAALNGKDLHCNTCFLNRHWISWALNHRFFTPANCRRKRNLIARFITQAGRRSSPQRRSRGKGRHHLRLDLLPLPAPAAGHHRPAVQQRARRRTGRIGSNFRRSQGDLRRHHGRHCFAAIESSGHDESGAARSGNSAASRDGRR